MCPNLSSIKKRKIDYNGVADTFVAWPFLGLCILVHLDLLSTVWGLSLVAESCSGSKILRYECLLGATFCSWQKVVGALILQLLPLWLGNSESCVLHWFLEISSWIRLQLPPGNGLDNTFLTGCLLFTASISFPLGVAWDYT